MLPMLAKLFAAILPAFWLLADKKKEGALSDLRYRVISKANLVTGYSASDPNTKAAFRKLLGEPPEGVQWDLDRPFHYDASTGHTTGVSTCGLVARGIMCLAGIAWPEWSRPYVPGRVFTDMINHAQKAGAYRTQGLPIPGDAFIIGNGLQTHMAIAINVDGNEVLSVDGGQVDGQGLQCIKQVSRDFSHVTLRGIIDTDKIAAYFTQ